MNTRHVFFPFLFLLPTLISASAQQSVNLPVTAKGAVLEKLAGGFSFTEGPSPDREGNVYFTDQPNDRILMWSITENLSTFMQPSGRSNGMFTDKDGFLWSCADEKNELWKIGQDKKVEVVTSQFNGKPFNGPNDVWVSPNGGAYITDPFYLRPWWDHKDMPQEGERVYFLTPDHKSLSIVIDDLKKPNGIVGTPDGKFLYVADIEGNLTWKYRINNDGTLSGKTLFCELGSDGMTLDEQGNLYLTGKGVTIFNNDGTKLGNIPIPENWTANICFGGKDHKSLFITATTGLYRVKMKVRGAF
jgi:gluconolactonase